MDPFKPSSKSASEDPRSHTRKNYIIKELNGQGKETPFESMVARQARRVHPEVVQIILEIETLFLYKPSL